MCYFAGGLIPRYPARIVPSQYGVTFPPGVYFGTGIHHEPAPEIWKGPVRGYRSIMMSEHHDNDFQVRSLLCNKLSLAR